MAASTPVSPQRGVCCSQPWLYAQKAKSSFDWGYWLLVSGRMHDFLCQAFCRPEVLICWFLSLPLQLRLGQYTLERTVSGGQKLEEQGDWRSLPSHPMAWDSGAPLGALAYLGGAVTLRKLWSSPFSQVPDQELTMTSHSCPGSPQGVRVQLGVLLPLGCPLRLGLSEKYRAPGTLESDKQQILF